MTDLDVLHQADQARKRDKENGPPDYAPQIVAGAQVALLTAARDFADLALATSVLGVVAADRLPVRGPYALNDYERTRQAWDASSAIARKAAEELRDLTCDRLGLCRLCRQPREGHRSVLTVGVCRECEKELEPPF